MTSETFLYAENSYYISDDNSRNSYRNRMIPISQIKRMWDFTDGFGIAQEGYKDIYVDKNDKNETLLDFYKRAYVPIPTPQIGDNTIQ